MAKFIMRRLLISVPTVIGISIVLFLVFNLAPGDPFGEIALNPNIPAEVRERLVEQLGINDPLPVRYVRWFTSILKGDWGNSFVNRAQVLDLIVDRLPTTLFVLGSAYVLALLIAIPVGIISAIKQYSLWDTLATTFAFIGFSLPTFFTGVLFILIFSIKLGWFPMVYTTHIEASGLDWVWAMIKQAAMPVTVLALFQAAELARYVRSSVLDVIHLDYVRTARSKGLVERKVILGHAVRNALIPVVTIMALQVPTIFTGAIVTEQIFRVPGIGSLLITSLTAKDTPVLMGIFFTYAVLVVTFNLVADVLYGILDPRIKYS
jgi:peptide/nickel transport system permease protein